MRQRFSWFEWCRKDPYFDGRQKFKQFWLIALVCLQDMLLTIWPCLFLQSHIHYIETYILAFAFAIFILKALTHNDNKKTETPLVEIVEKDGKQSV